ncbi:hypothetical protein ACOMHN_067317 [Nucella lapillus]
MSAMGTGTSWRQQYLDSLSSGLAHLLKSSKFHDITITAGAHTFKCHRVILSCISPYFEAMFSSGMKESVTGEVKIEGIEGDIFRAILFYIYSGIDIVKTENAEEVRECCGVVWCGDIFRAILSYIYSGIDIVKTKNAEEVRDTHCCGVVCGDIFRAILSYIYRGIDIVKTENAEEVLKGAAVLQMDCLQRICEEFLSRSLNLDNCITRWRLAHWHSCMQLSQTAWSYVMRHFPELSKKDDFLALEPDELISLLQDDNLCATDEEFIMATALRWVAYDQESRSQHLPAIFRSVRLSLANPQFLIDVVRKHSVIRESPEVLQTIDRAKNYHLLPSVRHNFVSELMSPRKSSRWEDVLIVMSGGESPKPPYMRSKNVFAYSFVSQQWFYLAPLPLDPGIEFTSCVYDNDIFVTGGGLLQTCFMRYRAKKNKWNNSRAKLKKGRRRHAMAACGNKIYVIGGFNAELEERARVQNSIEEYELDSGEWVEAAQLVQPVSSVSATAFGDRIFVLGGERNDSTDACVVQCFDTTLRSVTIVSNLPVNSKLSRAVVCDNYAYLMLFDGKVIKYLPEEHTTQVVGQIKDFDRVHFGMVHWRGTLYILGGQKIGPSRALCDAMITFDIRTNVSRTIQDRVPTPRLMDSCAKIMLDKKFLTKEVSAAESPTTPSSGS